MNRCGGPRSGCLELVLRLHHRLQTCRVSGLDADEHLAKAGFTKQPQQVVMLRHVQRGFGTKTGPVIVFKLVIGQELEQLARLRQVAD